MFTVKITRIMVLILPIKIPQHAQEGRLYWGARGWRQTRGLGIVDGNSLSLHAATGVSVMVCNVKNVPVRTLWNDRSRLSAMLLPNFTPEEETIC